MCLIRKYEVCGHKEETAQCYQRNTPKAKKNIFQRLFGLQPETGHIVKHQRINSRCPTCESRMRHVATRDFTFGQYGSARQNGNNGEHKSSYVCTKCKREGRRIDHNARRQNSGLCCQNGVAEWETKYGAIHASRYSANIPPNLVREFVDLPGSTMKDLPAPPRPPRPDTQPTRQGSGSESSGIQRSRFGPYPPRPARAPVQARHEMLGLNESRWKSNCHTNHGFYPPPPAPPPADPLPVIPLKLSRPSQKTPAPSKASGSSGLSRAATAQVAMPPPELRQKPVNGSSSLREQMQAARQNRYPQPPPLHIPGSRYREYAGRAHNNESPVSMLSREASGRRQPPSPVSSTNSTYDRLEEDIAETERLWTRGR